MFNKLRLKDVLVQYKKDFPVRQWNEEKYKWKAVKCFQVNWDVNADDFAGMLDKSLSAAGNLLTSANNFPMNMITGFAKTAPEEVRAMFIALYDETQDVYTRIKAFKDQSSNLLEKYGDGAAQHFQHENAISVYLWLRYPDKYYVYKFTEVKAVSQELESEYKFKKGAYADNIRNFYKFYDEICEEIQQDTALINLFKSQLTDTCYPDPQFKTLTFDIGFYISHYYSKDGVTTIPEAETGDKAAKAAESKWFPADYTPGLSEDNWVELLGDDKVFTQGSLEIMKRMKDYGGEATCKQLAVKYGETANFYNAGSSALAKRVAKKTGCPVMQRDEGSSRLWTVLYLGRDADIDEEGSYVWKLRDELSNAIDRVDLSDVSLYAHAGTEEDSRGYWFLSAAPRVWNLSRMTVGEVKAYPLLNENGGKRRVFQNFLDARAGDLVIGYESSPLRHISAIAKICAEQDGENIYLEKVEDLPTPITFAALKGCQELCGMEYFSMQNGSFFRLTKGEYDYIMDMIREENPVQPESAAEPYTKADFLEKVYMTEQQYDTLVSILKNKKNIILQGAPGVGKTFTAKRLAYSMMGEKDSGRVEFVQFHQNYSYEDFMMGYKPVDDGFEMKYGVFYRFCRKASNHPDKDYFFIIDEINRGNLSRIFGELLMLIERDYRDTQITLAYNDIPFSVPSNLYIIGMMNTADRSLAMIDYALRRRFSFFEMVPGFDSEGFIKYQNSLNSDMFNDLISKVKDLNVEIARDKSLGKGFCIGHSYFCEKDVCTEEWLKEVIDYDILPMLSEYWFDDADKLKRWDNVLHGVFQ